MKYEPDIDLTRKLQSQVDKLERMADAIGHTPVRHAVNERIVEIRLLLRDGNLDRKNKA